jgi:hypothetical protein
VAVLDNKRRKRLFLLPEDNSSDPMGHDGFSLVFAISGGWNVEDTV